MSKNYNKLFNNKNKESEKVEVPEVKEVEVPEVKEVEITVGVDLANHPDVTVATLNKKIYKTMHVDVKHLNVRSEPSKKGSKLGILIRGTKVTVTHQDGEWSEIEYTSNKKTKAYVMTKHIS